MEAEMARTAPDAFERIDDAAWYPLEPIGPPEEWLAVLRNVNHAVRWLHPVVVRQDTVAMTDDYITTADNPIGPDTYAIVHVWRIPVYAGEGGQTLGGAVHGRVVAGGDGGTVRISSVGGADSKTMNFSAPAGERQTFTGLSLDTSGTYETITLEIKSDAPLEEMWIINADFWLEPCASPLSAGDDGAGVYPQDDGDGAADKPLPTYRLRRVAENLENIAEERPGVVLSSSDDFRAARSATWTEDNWRAIERIPVRYGPRSSFLRVHANGWCDEAAARLRVWTDQTGYAGALELDLPSAAAWGADPVGSWETGTIPLDPVVGIGGTMLYAEVEGAGAGVEMDLYALCVWEER
jgi:hypothetical protein